MQEFASIMLQRQCNQRRGYEERRERRVRAYNEGPSATSHPFFAKPTPSSKGPSTSRAHSTAAKSSTDNTPLNPIPEGPPMETTD